MEAVEARLTRNPFRVVGSEVGIISESEEVVYTWMTFDGMDMDRVYNGGAREVFRVGFWG